MILNLLNLIDAIRHRLIRGHWCTHPKWAPWRKGDAGRFQYRVCLHCGRLETA